MESNRMASAAALFMLLALAVLVLSFVSCTVPAPFAFGAPVTHVNRAAETTLGPNAPIGFRLFPADNPWNQDISALPVQRDSAAYIAAMGIGASLHPDFGTEWEGAPIGIPYTLVSSSQPKVPIEFYYPDESDEGPYPISAEAPVEGGPDATGDRHIIMLDVDNQKLYEVYDAHYDEAHSRWEAGSGAIWDLTSNALRPDGWTSADAAGLPILPGLVRYDEVAGGAIRHALRFTAERTARAHIYPARHDAGAGDASLPPMGLRVRLKASVDISKYGKQSRVVLQALKTYGMILADNGSNWYISGASDRRYNDDDLHGLGKIKGSDFEVVDTSGLRNG